MADLEAKLMRSGVLVVACAFLLGGCDEKPNPWCVADLQESMRASADGITATINLRDTAHPPWEALDGAIAVRERNATARRKVYWLCWGRRFWGQPIPNDRETWEQYVKSVKGRYDWCQSIKKGELKKS